MIIKLRALFVLFLLGFATPTFAEAPSVQANILHEQDSIQPGQPLWVAVRIQIPDEWHTYWKNPGDAGMATAVTWSLPEGYQASAFHWPVPEKFLLNGIVGFGYEKEVTLLSQISVPKQLSNNEPVTIGANIKWLVCSDSECVPGESDASVTIPITATVEKDSGKWTPIFKEARSRLPSPNVEVAAQQNHDILEIQFPIANYVEGSKATFFPEENHECLDHNSEAVLKSSKSGDFTLSMKKSDQPLTADTLKGVVVVKGPDNSLLEAFEVKAPIRDHLISMADSPFSKGGAVGSTTSELASSEGLLTILALAFIGGMILNLMPCVLPVISFKILSFVQLAGKNRSLILQHGMAFSGGVISSFWVLAGVLLALQAYGHSVGWGFQLQEPLFVGGLAALLFIFGLSLFGVFEMGGLATSLAGSASLRKEGLSSSFFSGVLATTVATPCTGPFLGSAIGFAFAMPSYIALLIFTVLGLGMALPYMMLSAFPHLLRYLPRPGAWMDTFKQLMGFLMLATVLWLTWVFSAQTGSLGVVFLLAGLFCMAIGCWAYGKWGSPVNSKMQRSIGIGVAALSLILGGYIIVSSTSSWVAMLSGDTATSAKTHGKWETFSPERVAELRSQNVPVFIDFTAKWCLICQVNHLVLSNNAVDKEFEKMGVVRMKADWTKKDPMITEELAKLGRNSVPLYVLYGADSAESSPEILPQVLTPDIVLEHLKTLKK